MENFNETPLRHVLFGHKFYTGMDGERYTRLRPSECSRRLDETRLVYAISEDFRLVSFDPNRTVYTLNK